MKSKLKKYSLIIIAIIMVAVSVITLKVNAAEPTTGSLTIICHEQANGDTTTNPPLKGIEYTLYKVDDTCEDISSAETYIINNPNLIDIKETGEDGKVVFTNLELGRYYVKVTKVTDGTTYFWNYHNFLVDIPMTNTNGTGYEYNVVAEPKIDTSYGNLELTKVDNKGNPIEGVEFKVQVRKGSAVPMSLDDVSDVWTDFIPEGSTQVLTLKTDENGKIKLENLPTYYEYVSYRLVEISTKDKYILNPFIEVLRFGVDDFGGIYTNYDEDINEYFKNFITNVTEGDNLTTVTYMNEKPTIEKKVKNSAGVFVDSAGLNMKDIVTFKVTTDVPLQISDMTTYKITDTLPTGLTLDRDSITVEGTMADEIVTIPSEMYTLSDTGIELTFDTTKMNSTDSAYSNIIVTYNATFNDNSVIGGDGNINTASLIYTDKIDENGNEESTNTITDTAEVHTGGIKIEKVQKGSTSIKLPGAKFKIATSKANAEAGVFVTDENGADIEVTTDVNGLAEIKGLAYADDGTDTSYWLVETQAPTYTETVDGQEVPKAYNLLKSPVEVKVGKTTYETAVQVQNSKGLDLPLTGGIGIVLFVIAGTTIMIVAVKMNRKQKEQE